MKFKKLEVAGFKSFADKLEVKFGAGITAIVGPNGCGKSNVADSIRWVLGEQSAKLLRGSSMQDVIFNGTERRKSLSFCEVNLYFDNTDKELFPSLDFNEVVVSRKLYRSGESEYLLNKSVCRLKDIVDILRDAGMGREGYSIIGQGRIDELLSSKPEDRREIFEEAAGISKFKARKKEAERRLARTDEQLTRIIDVLNEKSRMLEPLTKQAENARKWLDLRDRLKILEINTYIYQYDTASAAKEIITNRINAITEEIDLRAKECDAVSASYNESMAAMNSVDKKINDLREELLKITYANAKTDGDIKLLKERISILDLQSEKLTAENEKLNCEYEQLLDYISQNTLSLESSKKELEIKRAEGENLSNELIKIVQVISEGESESDLNQRKVVDAMAKLADIKGNMSRLVTELETSKLQIIDLENRIKFNVSKLEIDTKTESELKKDIEELAIVKAELIEKRDTSSSENNEALNEVSVNSAKLDKLNEQYFTLTTQHTMLKNMQEAYEGFAFSVKKLLADVKKDKNLARRTEGVVASLLTVEPKFETAIEIALGNAVQNIVTQNEDDAKFLIEYLKQQRYGRVTFLPITSVKPRSIDPQFKAALSMPGVLGAATDFVKYDDKFKGIVAGLLGGTVITENMDVAVALAKKTGYGFKIVTMDGDVINPQGSITGGSKKSELNNIFGYDREIAELDVKIKAVKSQIDEASKIKTDNAAKAEKLGALIKEAREEIHSVEITLAAKSEAYKKLKDDNAALYASVTAQTAEIKVNKERVEAITGDLDSVTELERFVTTQKESASSQDIERRRRFEALRNERDALQELVTAAKVDVNTLSNTVVNLENEIARYQENVLTLISRIESNNVTISGNKVSVKSAHDELSVLSLPNEGADAERVKEIRAVLTNLDDFKQENQEKVVSLDERRMSLISVIQSLHERKNQENIFLVKVDTDIETMQQRVAEEYNLVYEECLPFKVDNYDLNSGIAESAKIKRQMSNLGNINVDAIEQCQELYASYSEMNEQKEDLVKAKGDLHKIIAELETEMLSRFAESFAQIQVNFRRIFKELFDGGNADLILQESEDLLEAGIEIVAQPPEKKLQSISLLSGGERALTAIAILFAILRLKPMPFCVLDEIEAALDDANAGRFAKYLRRFSEETQFIVITHRKPTMELADNLYGVTMEEKGVSKIVSVKLSEAVAAAEKAVQ